MTICEELLEDLKPEIEWAIEGTKRDGRERGFVICWDKYTSRYYSGTKCIGTECELHLREICSLGKPVGFFHTHPRETEGYHHYFSQNDIQSALELDYSILCVGLPDDKLACLTFNKSNLDYYLLKDLFEDREFVTGELNALSREIEYYLGRGMEDVARKLDDELSECTTILARLDEEIWQTLNKVTEYCEVKVE